MPIITSLEDLKRIREEALEKQKVKIATGETQVFVAMGTCGIAVGAHDTLRTILNYIEENHLVGIQVTQTGCIGLCGREPIVQVIDSKHQKVVYGCVNPDLAKRIMKDHIVDGKIVTDFVILA